MVLFRSGRYRRSDRSLLEAVGTAGQTAVYNQFLFLIRRLYYFFALSEYHRGLTPGVLTVINFQ